MTDKQPVTLHVKRRFEASAERVFDAWLDPETAGKWLFRSEEGEVVSARVDARVGGSFTFVSHRKEGDIEHIGDYLVIDRPRRLVFTFAVLAFSPEYDRVTIEIRHLDKGCELTLTSEMAPEVFAEWGEQTREGWIMILDALAVQLEA